MVLIFDLRHSNVRLKLAEQIKIKDYRNTNWPRIQAYCSDKLNDIMPPTNNKIEIDTAITASEGIIRNANVRFVPQIEINYNNLFPLRPDVLPLIRTK